MAETFLERLRSVCEGVCGAYTVRLRRFCVVARVKYPDVVNFLSGCEVNALEDECGHCVLLLETFSEAFVGVSAASKAFLICA